MGRGYSRRCAIEHKKVRGIYNSRKLEIKNIAIQHNLGDLGNHIDKEYFLQYIHEETDYAIITIRKILNRSQREIDIREKEI